MSLLRTTALSKVYRTDTVETTALNAVDITIGQGEFVAIMGQRLREIHLAQHHRTAGLAQQWQLLRER